MELKFQTKYNNEPTYFIEKIWAGLTFQCIKMPINYKDYPLNWRTEIVPAIRLRSGNKCEGTEMYPSCAAEHGKPHPETGSMVVLTTAHMDRDKTNNYYDPIDKSNPRNNLRHLCQRCHLHWDMTQHVQNRKYGRNHKGEHQLKLWRP